MKSINYLFILIALNFILPACKKDSDKKSSANIVVVPPIKDNDGNVYHSVTIGTQTWLVENLKTTTYNDGTAIPLVSDNTAWTQLTTPGYCWYNNDAVTYKETYGALYNWHAVNTGKLCPAGWHVPSDAEWTLLSDSLGGDLVSGGKMKEAGLTHWLTPNEGATNDKGLTVLPGGDRYDLKGTFHNNGSNAFFWSSSESSSTDAWNRVLGNNDINVSKYFYDKSYGFSVRCLKN